MPASLPSTASAPARVDPRGPRFAAAVTSVVLAGSLLAGPQVGAPLLAVQLFAFGAGVVLGLRFQPYGWFFRRAIRPRLAPPAELEDERPPRFAQGVGFGFVVLGLAGSLLALPALFYAAVGLALVAALLNAVFDFCLGCELYLFGQRLRARRPAAGTAR